MTVDDLLWSAIGAAVGFVVGLCLQVHWTRKDGAPAVRVTLSSRWQRVFFGVVSVLALLTTAVTATNAAEDRRIAEDIAAVTEAQQQGIARQTYCNTEIIRVITGNAGSNAADRVNLAALLAVVGDQVLNPPADPDALAEAFRVYREVEARNADARRPYPPPDCGR